MHHLDTCNPSAIRSDETAQGTFRSSGELQPAEEETGGMNDDAWMTLASRKCKRLGKCRNLMTRLTLCLGADDWATRVRSPKLPGFGALGRGSTTLERYDLVARSGDSTQVHASMMQYLTRAMGMMLRGGKREGPRRVVSGPTHPMLTGQRPCFP